MKTIEIKLFIAGLVAFAVLIGFAIYNALTLGITIG
tara:strand:+ start:219 stop:326 length:108 start_codon:yes stop_codon:yes gene_type:complete